VRTFEHAGKIDEAFLMSSKEQCTIFILSFFNLEDICNLTDLTNIFIALHLGTSL